MTLTSHQNCKDRIFFFMVTLLCGIFRYFLKRSFSLKVPSHESYKQRRAPPAACLHREEMPPFPLAIGFNAAFPPCSRVSNPRAIGNCGISSSEVSRPVSRVAMLLTLTPACIGRTSSDALHSLPFLRVFTLRQLHEERQRTAN